MNRWILPLFLLTSVAQATPLHPAAAVALQAGADAGLIEYKQRRPSPVVKREFVSSNLVVSIQEDGFVYTNRFSKTGMSRTVLAPRFLRERVVMDISILLGADVTDDTDIAINLIRLRTFLARMDAQERAAIQDLPITPTQVFPHE